MLLVILKAKKLWKHLTQTNCKKKKNISKEFRVEKLIKGKDDKSYVKWKV